MHSPKQKDILHGSVVTQTVLSGWANYISSSCKFPIVYRCVCQNCQSLWVVWQ